MKKILIDGRHADHRRVAIIDGAVLSDLLIESGEINQKKANIYKGRVTRVEPSLEAAFIDYGAERHGFLSLKEVSKVYFSKRYQESEERDSRPHIRQALREGQEILVQILKDERGNKGAALTTYISLAGSYLVLMPNNPKAGGISRRIEGEEREQMRNIIKQMDIPEGMGAIVRTAGVGKSIKELRSDLSGLINHWNTIQSAANENPSPCLIHKEDDAMIRAIRDYFRDDVSEIIVEGEEIYKQAYDYVNKSRQEAVSLLKHYQQKIPLFSRYQVETQIESAFNREVTLPSGGALVIDHTEALVSIDINSARATKGSDIEETAYHTNLEAAYEIARQLRVRDLAGLIVIDFIDMTPVRHQREVENRLRAAVKNDKARIQIGRISQFGLLEMSRQRLRPSLGESIHHICPRCNGNGFIRTVENLALSIIRIIEERALNPHINELHAQVPIDVGTYLLNEKRRTMFDIEQEHGIRIILIPNQYIKTPNYEIKEIRADGTSNKITASYQMSEEFKPNISDNEFQLSDLSNEKPAVSAINNQQNQDTEQHGLIKRLWSSLFGSTEKTTTSSEIATPPPRASIQPNTAPKRKAPESNNSNNSNRRNENRHQNRRNQSNQRHKQGPVAHANHQGNDFVQGQSRPQQANKQANNEINKQQSDRPRRSRNRRRNNNQQRNSNNTNFNQDISRETLHQTNTQQTNTQQTNIQQANIQQAHIQQAKTNLENNIPKELASTPAQSVNKAQTTKQTPEIKTSEIKTSEIKTSEIKTSEIKTSEIKTSEIATPTVFDPYDIGPILSQTDTPETITENVTENITENTDNKAEEEKKVIIPTNDWSVGCIGETEQVANKQPNDESKDNSENVDNKSDDASLIAKESQLSQWDIGPIEQPTNQPTNQPSNQNDAETNINSSNQVEPNITNENNSDENNSDKNELNLINKPAVINQEAATNRVDNNRVDNNLVDSNLVDNNLVDNNLVKTNKNEPDNIKEIKAEQPATKTHQSQNINPPSLELSNNYEYHTLPDTPHNDLANQNRRQASGTGHPSRRRHARRQQRTHEQVNQQHYQHKVKKQEQTIDITENSYDNPDNNKVE